MKRKNQLMLIKTNQVLSGTRYFKPTRSVINVYFYYADVLSSREMKKNVKKANELRKRNQGRFILNIIIFIIHN